MRLFFQLYSEIVRWTYPKNYVYRHPLRLGHAALLKVWSNGCQTFHVTDPLQKLIFHFCARKLSVGAILKYKKNSKRLPLKNQPQNFRTFPSSLLPLPLLSLFSINTHISAETPKSSINLEFNLLLISEKIQVWEWREAQNHRTRRGRGREWRLNPTPFRSRSNAPETAAPSPNGMVFFAFSDSSLSRIAMCALWIWWGVDFVVRSAKRMWPLLWLASTTVASMLRLRWI